MHRRVQLITALKTLDAFLLPLVLQLFEFLDFLIFCFLLLENIVVVDKIQDVELLQN